MDGGEALPEQPGVGEVLDRARAIDELGREVLAHLLAHVGVDGSVADNRGELRELAPGEGAHRVGGRADAHHVAVPQRFHPLGPGLHRPVGEARLDLVERQVSGRVEPTGQVAGVEEREPDPGLLGCRDEGRTHGVRVVVGLPAGTVVEVVELPDDGVARRHHLGEHPSREGEVGVGIETGGHGIHLFAPRPEVAAVAMGATTQHPVERVAVRVGEAGQDDTAQSHVGVARLGVRGDLAEPPVRRP